LNGKNFIGGKGFLTGSGYQNFKAKNDEKKISKKGSFTHRRYARSLKSDEKVRKLLIEFLG